MLKEVKTSRYEPLYTLTEAEIASDYKKLNDVTSHKLTWLVINIEKVRKYAEENNFISVDSARDMIEGVKRQIIELKSKIT